MKVYEGLNNLPDFKNTVITVGTFDGVHAAHQSILNRLVNMADEINGESILITFHPHPKHVLQSNQSDLKILSTPNEKTELLKSTGIHHLVYIPFTIDFSNISAEDYIEKFLVANFHPKKIVVGFNHHFGKERKGNGQMLRDAGLKFGFDVIELEKQVEDEIAISSTAIRNFIVSKKIKEANKLLNHPYSLIGIVNKGKQLGRTIGYPTANIKPLLPEKLIPCDGVYAVTIECSKGKFNGMLNIGFKPTVDGKERTIEVNIFDFNFDIYEEQIKVSFHTYIRDEKKFESLEALKNQLLQDKEIVSSYLTSHI
jgi:riboflavin kinase/FMN adenylyltransferase